MNLINFASNFNAIARNTIFLCKKTPHQIYPSQSQSHKFQFEYFYIKDYIGRIGGLMHSRFYEKLIVSKTTKW